MKSDTLSEPRSDVRGITSAAKLVPPVLLREVELSAPMPHLPPGRDRYKSALVLVRLHGQPLGHVCVDLPPEGVAPMVLTAVIARELGDSVRDHLAADGVSPSSWPSSPGIHGATPTACREGYRHAVRTGPIMSVVVVTRDRASILPLALDSLSVQEYANYEILLVDNAPSSTATRDLVLSKYRASGRIRYLRCDWPGTSAAKNVGITESRGSLVAFTDDDIVVDREWLGRLAARFHSEPKLAAVTGLVLPLELETQPQVWFEQWGGFGKGFESRTFDLAGNPPANPIFPYAIGTVGSGNNMAFRREILIESGGFDLALGPGTASRGAEDLDLFFGLITSRRAIGYEPAAIVRHLHRRDYESLRKQVGGGSVVPVLVKHVLKKPSGIPKLLAAVPRGIAYATSSTSGKNSNKGPAFPRGLANAELAGMLSAPHRYLLSLWAVRRLSARFETVPRV